MYTRKLKAMGIDEVLQTWAAYFGEQFEKTLQDILTVWLRDEAGISADPMVWLAAINRVVISNHPRQYKRLPGIAELEAYKAAAWTLYNDTAPGQDLSRLAIEDNSELATPEQIAAINRALFGRAG